MQENGYLRCAIAAVFLQHIAEIGVLETLQHWLLGSFMSVACEAYQVVAREVEPADIGPQSKVCRQGPAVTRWRHWYMSTGTQQLPPPAIATTVPPPCAAG